MNQIRPNIICFLTDRLHLGYLGAYGNSWIGTAAFDRLYQVKEGSTTFPAK